MQKDELAKLVEKGIAEYQNGNYELSIKEYENALSKLPPTAKEGQAIIYFNMALSFWKIGKIDKTELCLKKTIEADSDRMEAYDNLGKLYYDNDKFDMAITILKKGLEAAGKYVPIHHSLAEIYYRIGKIKKAESHLKKCLEYNDGYKFIDDVYELQKKIKKTAD
jgi:tetratricopeptide (TPR) repeat protein